MLKHEIILFQCFKTTQQQRLYFVGQMIEAEIQNLTELLWGLKVKAFSSFTNQI